MEGPRETFDEIESSDTQSSSGAAIHGNGNVR